MSFLYTPGFQFVFIAKVLQCYSRSPEQLAEGEEKAIGINKTCRSSTSYCWKAETPAGIAQGCGESELSLIFSLLFGTMSDSCNTINLGDSYTGCVCHTNLCNTASIKKASSLLKAGILLTLIYSIYTLFHWMGYHWGIIMA